MAELSDLSAEGWNQNLPRVEKVALLAARQHGVLALSQLLAPGVSKSWVYRRVREGWLRIVLPGVFAVGHTALSWRGELMAAVLWCGPGAAISHMPAAALSDLLPTASRAVHVTVARGGRNSRRGVRVHQTRRLDARERAVIDGIPVTSVERTLLDIAGVVRPERLEQAFEQAIRMNRLDFSALKQTLDNNRGRKGAARLRSLVAEFDPLAPQANEGIERTFLRLIRKARLPNPEVNVWIHNHEVDFLWRKDKLIVELDSREFHLTPTAFESDRRRDTELQLLGYTVLRITHRRLAEEPAAVIRDLRCFLSACGP
jgi:very-short-patch-repair endonuclease/predicted transcriptional regulator of viral defense system